MEPIIADTEFKENEAQAVKEIVVEIND